MTITYDKQILIKRGNTVEASSYVGPLGELVLDTDTNRVYVHDGVTAGGTLVGDDIGFIYGNANIAAYLPTDPTITSLIANAGVQSANIASLVANAAAQADQISTVSANVTTANTNMKGYVDASISSANIGMKTYVDSKISANIAALVDGAPGALDTLNELAAALGDDANLSVTLTNTLSNVTANISTLTSNAAVQAGDIASLLSNAGSQHAAISSLQSNISILTSNAAVQAGLIAGLQSNVNTYSNSNVASYLTTYGGNISAHTLTFSDLSEQTTAYQGTGNLVIGIEPNTIEQAGGSPRSFLNFQSGSDGNIVLGSNSSDQWTKIANDGGANFFAFNSNYETMLWPDGSVQTTAYTGNINTPDGYINFTASPAPGGSGITFADATTQTTAYSNVQVATYLSDYNGSINFTASPAIISGVGIITTINANVTANLTVGGIVTANYISGNGSAITSLSGAAVSGNVAQSSLAYAVNISGVGLNQEYHVAMLPDKTGAYGVKAADYSANITINPVENRLTIANVAATGSIQTSGVNGRIGYSSGGFVQQSGNTSGISLNTISGNIQLASVTIPSGTVHSVALTNNKLEPTDLILVQATDANGFDLHIGAYYLTTNTALIYLRNITGGAVGPIAPMLKFALIKAPGA